MNDDEKKDQQEQTSNEEVSKAFGNEEEKKPAEQEADPKAAEQEKSDQKQEGAVSASKEKTQSGKTYTQEEVDAMMAKARKKYAGKGETTDQITETQTTEEETPKVEELTQDLATGLTIDKYAQAELKASMAIAGVDPQKVQRAVRLIDVMNVIENGQYSEEKANQEIEALLQDWPELKQAKEESNSNAFYFGAPEQSEQNQEEKQKNMFSSIFGNK